MADIGSHHFVKGAGSRNVLVPQPSDDPHDVSISGIFLCLLTVVSAKGRFHFEICRGKDMIANLVMNSLSIGALSGKLVLSQQPVLQPLRKALAHWRSLLCVSLVIDTLRSTFC